MNFAKAAFACLAAIFFAGPVHAVTVAANGVVIFTQADVMAGGITPGDTPGFPASILVPGSYQLGSPLSVTTLKNGIVVSASAVTIDLNGFKISGNNVGRNGIYSDQIETAVSNGMVRGFSENGIRATGELLTVDRLRATNNGLTGIYAGGNARIIGSVASGNGSSGISCALNCSVQDSTVTENGYTGIGALSGGVVLGNVIVGNDYYGITGYNTGFGNNTIYGNTPGPILGALIPMQPNACNPACVPSPP